MHARTTFHWKVVSAERPKRKRRAGSARPDDLLIVCLVEFKGANLKPVPIFVTIALSLTCQVSHAGSYRDNPGRKLFDLEPCTAVLRALDGQSPTEGDPLFRKTGPIGVMALAWGFILGFDAAKGGLWKGSTTTLERFKDACYADDKLTGTEILQELEKSM